MYTVQNTRSESLSLCTLYRIQGVNHNYLSCALRKMLGLRKECTLHLKTKIRVCFTSLLSLLAPCFIFVCTGSLERLNLNSRYQATVFIQFSSLVRTV